MKIFETLKSFFTFLGWPILVLPYALLFLGALLNQYVIWHNGLQMPVAMPGCSPAMISDVIHTCMTATTKTKWLGDVFISDSGVVSLGDIIQDYASAVSQSVVIVWGVFMFYCVAVKRKLSL